MVTLPSIAWGKVNPTWSEGGKGVTDKRMARVGKGQCDGLERLGEMQREDGNEDKYMEGEIGMVRVE